VLLALTVALAHGGTAFGYLGMNGVLSVQCFYIVSGFLITFILSTKYDGSTRPGRWLF
jgi:peptidoglycan/LPS O-acetylase OafA/YrhL